MITINLLPEEYRAAQRTPMRVMVATVAAVAVNCVLLAYAGWLFLATGAEVRTQLQFRQDEVASLKPAVEYFRKLETENKLFSAREQTLSSITENRIGWTEKVDQLVDVISAGGDDDNYLVWLTDLTITQSDGGSGGRNAKGAGNLTASGYSGSPDFGLVADFFEDLKESPFIGGFYAPERPEGELREGDPDLLPSEIFSFRLDLGIKDAAERKADAEAAASRETEAGGDA